VDEAWLRVAWARDAGTARGAEQALAALLTRYGEPHRRYHTTKHLTAVLLWVDELLPAVPVPDATAVRLAAWFHDAIYDPTAAPGANEDASASLAGRVLTELDASEERRAAVERLVRVTAAHAPTSVDEAVLIDADLAILGERPAVYDAYCNGIRAEYAHVDDAAWRAGRTAVLHAFLARPAIFHTTPMAVREGPARANLTAELASLAIAPG
jgi:predicted metal-dependent HD superfamily phosphohydrolase